MSKITDEQLDSLKREAEVLLKITETLRPLKPEARARVFRCVLAYHGFAVPKEEPEYKERIR